MGYFAGKPLAMIKKFLLSFPALSLLLFSCKKTNVAGNSGQLIGNYKFLYVTLQAQSTTLESAGGQTQKTVTYSNYTTVQNSGTVNFTADSISSNGVGYTADFTAMGYVYLNNVLTDSVPFPFSETYPPSNTATKYDVIGQDSIFFHGGYPIAGLGGGSAIAPPNGGRFSFKSDTLFMVSHFLQNTPPQNSGGITISSSATGVATVVMLKQ